MYYGLYMWPRSAGDLPGRHAARSSQASSSSHSDSVNSVIMPTGHARKPRSPKSRAKHEVFLCLANISAQKAATRAERDLSNLLRADRKEVVKRKVQSRKNYARADRATAHEHAAHLEQVHQLEDLKSVKTTSHQIHSMQVDDAGLSGRERAKAPWPQQRILAERSTRGGSHSDALQMKQNAHMGRKPRSARATSPAPLGIRPSRAKQSRLSHAGASQMTRIAEEKRRLRAISAKSPTPLAKRPPRLVLQSL